MDQKESIARGNQDKRWFIEEQKKTKSDSLCAGDGIINSVIIFWFEKVLLNLVTSTIHISNQFIVVQCSLVHWGVSLVWPNYPMAPPGLVGTFVTDRGSLCVETSLTRLV